MFRVLLPVDSSEARALAQAQTAASLPHAAEDVEVTLIHVFEEESVARRTAVTQLSSGRTVRDFLAERNVDVMVQSRFGDPATEILHAADDIDADLVVLGGRKRSPLGSLLFGSVSQAVTLDSRRPVTVTGGAQEVAAGRSTGESGERSVTSDEVAS